MAIIRISSISLSWEPKKVVISEICQELIYMYVGYAAALDFQIKT